jgi:serine/threonine-protein kinase
MRVVDGQTLADRVRSDGMSARQALALLAPIASALDVAHAARLVHRDVKPQNILLTSSGHPYLADFGVVETVRWPRAHRSGQIRRQCPVRIPGADPR